MLDLTRDIRWLDGPGAATLDLDGPVDVPFERFEADWVLQPVADRFDVVADRFASKLAVDDGEVRLTYSEIKNASLALAGAIALNASPGRPVGILLKRTGYFPVAALACLRAGLPLVPIDPGQPAERMALVRKEAGLQLVIVDGEPCGSSGLFDDLPQLDVTRSLEGVRDRLPRAVATNESTFILYTSGSLGRPKGICNHQAAILHRVAHFTNAAHLNADDRFLVLSSTGTIAGIRDVFASLLNGATLILADPGKIGFGGILNLMDREKVTVCYAVPSLLRALFRLHDARSAFRHLRLLRLGGDIVWEHDITLCRKATSETCHILIGYGSTEAPTAFQWFVPRDWPDRGARLPCGRPVEDVGVALVDEDGSAPDSGQVGELLIRSRHIALGTWQDGKLQDGIREGSPSSDVFRSGDLVRMRPDGLAELVGRKGRSFKIRGRRIDPGELESVARSSDDVGDAAVVVRSEGGEATGMDLFVVPRSRDLRPGDLNELLARRLPDYMRPGRVYLVNEIPLLGGFKPDLAALAKYAIASEAASAPVNGPPADFDRSDRAMTALKSAWTKVLSLKSFRQDEDWELAGGDSLKALSLVLLIERELGVRVPLDILHRNRRPSDIARALDRLLSDQPGGLEDAASGLPLIFLMPGMGGDELSLAKLRTELDGKVRFVLIEYPSSAALIKDGLRFETIVDSAIMQIHRVAQTQTIHLVGYSFGGFPVWEVARRLRGAGRRLGAIVLLDANRGDHVAKVMSHQNTLQRVRRVARSIRFQPRHSADRALFEAMYFLVRRAPPALLEHLPTIAKKFSPGIATKLLLYLDGSYRARALRGFKLSGFDHPATLFRSMDLREESADCGWSDVCPKLDIVFLEGTHVSMLEQPLRSVLGTQLVELVKAAEGRADTTLAPP